TLVHRVDLVVLLPVGWLADRIGLMPVLGLVLFLLGLGTLGAAVGSLTAFIGGSLLYGLGLAGWMLPLGVIREHIDPGTLAWRTGLYRVGVDATSFVGPLICGLVGEAHAGRFIGLVGLVAVVLGARLLWRGSVGALGDPLPPPRRRMPRSRRGVRAHAGVTDDQGGARDGDPN